MKVFILKEAKTPNNPMGKDVCNRNGDDIEIINVREEKGCSNPIVAKIKGESDEEAKCYLPDGSFKHESIIDDMDLMLKE